MSRTGLDRKHGAPKNEVHLDLDLGRVVADQKLDIITIGVGRQVSAVSLGRKRSLHGGQLLGDGLQGGLAVRAISRPFPVTS